MLVRGAVEVALVGAVGDASFDGLAAVVARQYVPSLVMAGGANVEGIALMDGRADSVATAYVCRQYACLAPTRDPVELGRELEAARLIP